MLCKRGKTAAALGGLLAMESASVGAFSATVGAGELVGVAAITAGVFGGMAIATLPIITIGFFVVAFESDSAVDEVSSAIENVVPFLSPGTLALTPLNIVFSKNDRALNFAKGFGPTLDFVTSWGPALGDKAAAMISLGLGWSDQNLALKNLGLGLRAQNPRDSSTSVGDQRNSGKENHGTHELSQPALRNADKPERKGTPENANEARNTVNQEGGSTAPRTQKNSKVPDQKVNYGDMTIFRSNRSSLQSDRDSLPRGWIGTRDHFGYDAGQGEDHAMHVNFHEHLYVDPPDTRAVRA